MHDTPVSASVQQIDPVELAVSCGHGVAVDLLTEILEAREASRCLQIHELIGPLIQTLQRVEETALVTADDLLARKD
jgi:hypothetical protein